MHFLNGRRAFYEMFDKISLGKIVQKPSPGRKGDNGGMGQAGVARHFAKDRRSIAGISMKWRLACGRVG